MITYETLRLKILKIRRIGLAKLRRKKIKNDNFTIISNNCWGGMIYESYNLIKKSPTVGMFFFADDYIKFIYNLEKYLNKELKFIKKEESKWKNEMLHDKKFGTYPLAKLDDIEIFFVHYKTEQEAKEKWERRCKRINFDKIIYKFNDQNNCKIENLKDFINFPAKNKLFFTCKEWKDINDECIIKIKQLKNREPIFASYEPFGKNKYVNLEEIINNL